MQPRKHARVLNIILASVFLILTLAIPIRGLLSTRDVAAEAQARGHVVFDADNVNSAARTTDYILLFLFGSLTLVYAWRALKPAPRPSNLTGQFKTNLPP